MINVSRLLGPMRLPFLLLTPACVLLGLETARQVTTVDTGLFFMVMTGAVAAHISVNAFNEYFDFRSGLDLKTERTPFSGGSGTLPSSPELAPQALGVAIIALIVTAGFGLYFISIAGLQLLPLGLAGLAVIVAYTHWLTRHPLLCLIAPGFAFGPLMVVGTHVVLSGHYSMSALVVSLIPFFLVNNLLLLNQYPDIDADRTVGRRTFPVAFGIDASNVVYAIFTALAYGSLIVGVFLKLFPRPALLGLAALVIALPAILGVIRIGKNTERMIPVLGLNVAVSLVTPILVAFGLHYSN